MKRIVAEKLKDQTGASLAFALVFLLILAMVGASCLVAATVSSGNMESMSQDRQAYYSVSSAAETLSAKMEGARCDKQGGEWTCTMPGSTDTSSAQSNDFAGLLAGAVAANASTGKGQSGTVVQEENTCMLTFDSMGGVDGASTYTVSARMYFDKDLNANITFSVADSRYESVCKLNCVVPAAVSYASDGTPQTVIWQKATIFSPSQSVSTKVGE